MNCWFIALDGSRFAKDVGDKPPEIVEVSEWTGSLADPLESRRRLFRREPWAEQFGRGMLAPYQRWFQYREIDQ